MPTLAPRSVDVSVGARQPKAAHDAALKALESPRLRVVNKTASSAIIERELRGEGSVYWSDMGSLWIVVRYTPRIENSRGQTLQPAEQVDVKFNDHLYFLANDDPHYEEKKASIETQPSYGYAIRPLKEITDANRAAAQAEAIRAIQGVKTGEEAKGIIKALAPALQTFTQDELAEMFETIRKASQGEDDEEEGGGVNEQDPVVKAGLAPSPSPRPTARRTTTARRVATPRI